MVVVRYPGLRRPRVEMEALRRYHDHLLQLMILCRPSGPDYAALLAAKDALSRTAEHFTGDPGFFARKPPVGNGC